MTSTTTSFESSCNLSIPDLLRILTDKLYLECSRLREYDPPPAIPTASLETEIESLETRAHDVLRVIPLLRNMLQPVNKLPPEILSRIAQCFLHKNGGARDTKLIVPLTHVCRYWRRSITSDPANWTLISNDNEHLTALTLERAKAAPLQVSLAIKDPPTCCVPAPYIQNIDSLQVTNVPSIEVLREAFPGFPESTPNLRSLVLSALPWGSGSVDPFKSLTPTLGCLSLCTIPLYPSILRLRSLTELAYTNYNFDLTLDTFLGFLEENISLERATLEIRFKNPRLFDHQRPAPIKNDLRYLSISSLQGGAIRALLSGISLRRGADLEIIGIKGVELNDTLVHVSPAHHLNLGSPTFMEYRSYERTIRLLGPSGKVSLRNIYIYPPSASEPFGELPLLPLSNVREFHLVHRVSGGASALSFLLDDMSLPALVFDHAPFPGLEAFAIDCATSVSHLLSSLFSNPFSLRSLKTLAFLNCELDEAFMKELTRYASERKETTSASLHRVVIVRSDGVFPSFTAIHELRKLVPIVDVKMDTELPKDLA